MANIEFRVKVIKSPDGTTATVAEIDGSIDASTIQQFQQVMDKLVERGVKNLILDCTNIKYINSTGLGTLLKYTDTFESIGGHVAFCRVPSKVMLVMEMLGFNALFNIVADEASALRSFAGRFGAPPTVAVKVQPSGAQQAPAAPQTAAPAPPQAAASFPTQAPCARCRVTLDIPTAGKYRCPRCGAVLLAEAGGRVRFFASKKERPISLSLPSNARSAEMAGEIAMRCSTSAGFSDDAVTGISSAVIAACKNVVERAYDNDGMNIFHVLLAPEGAVLTVKIADYGKTFDFGATGTIHTDPRFAPVLKKFDVVEHRVNPRGGNLLTLIKNRA